MGHRAAHLSVHPIQSVLSSPSRPSVQSIPSVDAVDDDVPCSMYGCSDAEGRKAWNGELAQAARARVNFATSHKKSSQHMWRVALEAIEQGARRVSCSLSTLSFMFLSTAQGPVQYRTRRCHAPRP
jgi:hypothetical protein